MEAVRTHEFIPPAAQHYVDELRGRDLPCEVTSTPRSVTVACTTTRVRATAEFRRQGKHWRHVDGVLTIDGLRCNTVRDFDELERVLADPDRWLEASLTGDELEKLRDVKEVALPSDSGALVDLDDASMPTEVRHCARSLAAGVASVSDATVTVERMEADVWMVSFGRAEHARLFITFVRFGRSWGISGIVLVRPGADHGLSLGRSLERALAAMGGDSTPEADKVMGRPAQAPRGKNDQIRAKTNTVIRT